ncbi:unnamed protein product [Mytilus coruscus]|uniref:CCHC-type domain-containing protein n=1 Tax=Mytilus coruscus TaxID=42192 RepID=A0A6J8EEU0_MYTCO|nr:unnamed protein product [Mytilus coruscus]
MSDIEPDKLPDMEGVELSCQADSDEITNADLLSLMKTYFTRKLTGIERNFANTTHDLPRKVHKSESSFKFKGNKVQFDLNSDMLDNIDIAVDCIEHRRYEKAVKVLKESGKSLKKRNKLIRIADKSEGGWKTVDEYLSDDVASDSEDEKRIRAADGRAVKKLKTVKQDKRQNIKKRPMESACGPSSIAHNGNNGGFSQQQPFLVAGASAPITSRRNRARDICYNCGLYGHWAKDCKKGGNSAAFSHFLLIFFK